MDRPRGDGSGGGHLVLPFDREGKKGNEFNRVAPASLSFDLSSTHRPIHIIAVAVVVVASIIWDCLDVSDHNTNLTTDPVSTSRHPVFVTARQPYTPASTGHTST
jgi:hypothetical protein